MRRGGFRLHVLCRGKRASAEKQRDTPDACKTDKCIDDAADKPGLSAKQPSHEVKLKNTDQTPVQRTDNTQNQC